MTRHASAHAQAGSWLAWNDFGKWVKGVIVDGFCWWVGGSGGELGPWAERSRLQSTPKIARGGEEKVNDGDTIHVRASQGNQLLSLLQ